MTEMTGQCLCGAVKFKASAVVTDHHVCHCGMCRRWNGSPVMMTDVQDIRIDGEDHLSRFDSSAWAQRIFCKTCGSHLFYYLKLAQQYLVAVGTFDDSSPFKLVGEIYVDHQPQGYCFKGELSRKTEAEFLAELQSG